MSNSTQPRARRLGPPIVFGLVAAAIAALSLLNHWWVAAAISLLALVIAAGYIIKASRSAPIWMGQPGSPAPSQKRFMMADLRPDIAAAKKGMGFFAWKSNREVHKLVDYLRNGEQVTALAAGVYGGGGGLVALTTHRVLFIKDGWLSKTSQDFRIDRVASVEVRAHLFTATLILFAEGDADGVTIEKVWNSSAKNMRTLLQDAMAQAGFGSPTGYGGGAPAPTEQTRGSTSDIISRLQSLEQIKATLPAARYEALKDKILNGE